MQQEVELRALNLRLSASTSSALGESRTERGLCMDESDFRALYDLTSTPLLRYLHGMTRNSDAAKDLLQETYCRFLNAHRPQLDQRQARNYLFRIATNLLRDRWQHLKEDLPSEDSVETLSAAPHYERTLGVRQAFDRLKPRERQLLWLAYLEGSNHREIAESTGLRPGSIRLLLFRARHKLAQLITSKSPVLDPEVRK